jgi:hypothetical protein
MASKIGSATSAASHDCAPVVRLNRLTTLFAMIGMAGAVSLVLTLSKRVKIAGLMEAGVAMAAAGSMGALAFKVGAATHSPAVDTSTPAKQTGPFQQLFLAYTAYQRNEAILDQVEQLINPAGSSRRSDTLQQLSAIMAAEARLGAARADEMRGALGAELEVTDAYSQALEAAIPQLTGTDQARETENLRVVRVRLTELRPADFI